MGPPVSSHLRGAFLNLEPSGEWGGESTGIFDARRPLGFDVGGCVSQYCSRSWVDLRTESFQMMLVVGSLAKLYALGVRARGGLGCLLSRLAVKYPSGLFLSREGGLVGLQVDRGFQ